MGNEISSTVTCKLCRRVFVKPPGAIIQPGAGTNARLAEFAGNLRQHFIEKHARENGAVELQGMQFIAMLRLLSFDIRDRELAEQHDFLRWQVHQATLTARLADDKLELRAAELAEEFWIGSANCVEKETAVATIKARLIEVFKGYRQIIEEPGRYTVHGPVASQNGLT